MSQARDRSDPPRAIVHKRILDVAESRPDASMAEIADEVTVASTELVEKVLEEYGDPGEAADGQPPPEPAADQGSASGPASDGDLPPPLGDADPGPDSDPDADVDSPAEPAVVGPGADKDPAEGTDPDPETDTATEPADARPDDPPDEADPDRDLTDRQRDALRVIRNRPEAAQSAVAEELGVTAGTVSRWLNDLPDFNWNRRQEIAETYLNGTMNATTTTTADQPSLEDLLDRLETIESRLEADPTPGTSLEPELVQKIMHACLHSDRITEDEELELLRTFLAREGD